MDAVDDDDTATQELSVLATVGAAARTTSISAALTHHKGARAGMGDLQATDASVRIGCGSNS